VKKKYYFPHSTWY